MTNVKFQIKSKTQMSNSKNQKYNLEERTAKFGEDIIDFVKLR